MASFGENLRREREMRSVSLEEISVATKISVRFLSAIEKEEFDKLPGGIFNRGFVRAFAGYLGLDEERIVAEYLLAAGEAEAPVSRAVADRELGPGYARPVFLGLVILGMATALLYGWYGRRLSRVPAGPSNVLSSPAPAPLSVAPQPAPPPADRTVPASQATAATESAPKNEPVRGATESLTGTPAASSLPATAENTLRLRLQIDVIEPSWVSVTADGHRLFSRTLQSRETLSVTAAQMIRLTTGNASAVVLTLNGETLAPLGKPGEVRTIMLTEKDLKTSPP